MHSSSRQRDNKPHIFPPTENTDSGPLTLRYNIRRFHEMYFHLAQRINHKSHLDRVQSEEWFAGRHSLGSSSRQIWRWRWWWWWWWPEESRIFLLWQRYDYTFKAPPWCVHRRGGDVRRFSRSIQADFLQTGFQTADGQTDCGSVG